jgi:hypothetical protein
MRQGLLRTGRCRIAACILMPLPVRQVKAAAQPWLRTHGFNSAVLQLQSSRPDSETALLGCQRIR